MMTETIRSTAEDVDVAIGSSGALGTIVLNRPRARNAITADMRSRIAAAFPNYARDPNIYAVMISSDVPGVFSAGGDLRELSALVESDFASAKRLLADKYALVWLQECFSKPTVSLIDGIVMGNGVALTMFGTHRVAGERYEFAMPEAAVGCHPDDGMASVFARMPGHIGMYLGLTGRRIGRADAYALGLVTHCIPATRFAEISAGLADADPVDPLLDDRHEHPGEGDLPRRREPIEACFGAPTLEDVLARLEERSRGSGEDSLWCGAVLANLQQRSPTALAVIFRHIRTSAERDLRQILAVDYQLACQLVQTQDFREGVRAVLKDKDNTPRWSPVRVEMVDQVNLANWFAPSAAVELSLPTREEMQAARV
jgi:enoyl-CoA hydratase